MHTSRSVLAVLEAWLGLPCTPLRDQLPEIQQLAEIRVSHLITRAQQAQQQQQSLAGGAVLFAWRWLSENALATGPCCACSTHHDVPP